MDPTPQYNPPDLKVGDTYPGLAFQYTDTADGTPIDFPDGTEALAQLRLQDGTLLYTWQTDDESAQVSGNAVALAAIPANVTQTFPAGPNSAKALWEYQVTTPDGVVASQLTGSLTLYADRAYV